MYDNNKIWKENYTICEVVWYPLNIFTLNPKITTKVTTKRIVANYSTKPIM